MPDTTHLHRRGSFLYADVHGQAPGLPARFRESLPTRDSDSGPPEWFVVHQLELADHEMVTRVVEAIDSWSASPAELARRYGKLLGIVALRAPQSDAVSAIVRAVSARHRATLLSAIALWRRDPGLEDLYLQTGGAAVLAWFSDAALEEIPTTHYDLLYLAAAETLDSSAQAEPWSEAESACLDALDVLTTLGTSRAKEIVSAFEARVVEPSENLRRRFENAGDPGRGDSTELDEPFAWTGHPALYLHDPNEAIRVANGAADFLRARPDEAVWLVMALQNLIADPAALRFERMHALKQLIDLDVDLGIEAAADVTEDLAPLAAPIVRFRTPEAIGLYLDELSLLESPSDIFQYPTSLMRHSRFDTETDCFPNEHHFYLARFARLVPALDEALFDEIAPVSEQAAHPEALEGFYRLRAYLPSASYEMILPDIGDWLDVPMMVALLNTICEDLRSTERFLSVETDFSQEACVVAGLAESLQRAAADGVIFPTDENAAADRGSAFEDEILGR